MSEAALQPPRGAARPAAPEARPRAVLLWLLALPFLGGLVFIAFFALAGGGGRTAIVALAVLTGMLCFVPMILDQGRESLHRHFFLSLFGFGYFIYMVVPVFTLYLFEDVEEIPGSVAIMHVLPADVLQGQLAALTALAALLLGYALPIGRRVGRALPAPERQWSSTAAISIGLGLIALGWVVYLGNQFGLIPERAGSGVLGAIAGTTIFGIALLTIAWLNLRSRMALLVLAVLIPPTMFFNFFTGSKTMFLAAPTMVAFGYVVVRRVVPMRWILLGVLVIALYYPLAEFHRGVILQGLTLCARDVIGDAGSVFSRTASYAQTFKLAEYLGDGLRMTSARLEGLGILSVIVRDTPDRVPYQGGWTIGYIALSYVPRLLWPGKPIITIGQWITDHYGPGPQILSNTGPTWMGEFYLNFGYAGITIGMALLGIYFRILHEIFFRPHATIPALLIGTMIIFSTVPHLQGGLVGPVNGVIFMATPFLAMHLLVCALSAPPRDRTSPERTRSHGSLAP